MTWLRPLLTVVFVAIAVTYVMGQCRRSGRWIGLPFLWSMNHSHSALTDWGLGHVGIGKGPPHLQSLGRGLGYFLAPLQNLGVITQNFSVSGSTLARAYLGVPSNYSVDVDAAPPPVYELGASHPNPAVGGATIAYSLARAEPARLAIYDLGGRLVKELKNEATTAGPHSVRWDGADRSGRPAPVGLYLYRLETPGYSASRRLVLIR